MSEQNTATSRAQTLTHPSDCSASIHLSVCPLIQPSIQPFVCPSIHLIMHPQSIHLSIHPPVHKSIHQVHHSFEHLSMHPFFPSVIDPTNQPFLFSIHLFMCPLIHLCLSACSYIHPSYHPFSCISIHPSVCPLIQHQFHQPFLFSIHPSIHASTHPSACPYIYLSFIHLSVYPPVHSSICLSIDPTISVFHPSIYSSIHPSIYLSSFYPFIQSLSFFHPPLVKNTL